MSKNLDPKTVSYLLSLHKVDKYLKQSTASWRLKNEDHHSTSVTWLVLNTESGGYFKFNLNTFGLIPNPQNKKSKRMIRPKSVWLNLKSSDITTQRIGTSFWFNSLKPFLIDLMYLLEGRAFFNYSRSLLDLADIADTEDEDQESQVKTQIAILLIEKVAKYEFNYSQSYLSKFDSNYELAQELLDEDSSIETKLNYSLDPEDYSYYAGDDFSKSRIDFKNSTKEFPNGINLRKEVRTDLKESNETKSVDDLIKENEELTKKVKDLKEGNVELKEDLQSAIYEAEKAKANLKASCEEIKELNIELDILRNKIPLDLSPTQFNELKTRANKFESISLREAWTLIREYQIQEKIIEDNHTPEFVLQIQKETIDTLAAALANAAKH